MYILDTNHCSLAINSQADIIAKLATIDRAQVSTCVIVQAELIYMAENSQQRTSNLARVKQFLNNIFIYKIASVTAEIYGAFQADLMGASQFCSEERIKVFRQEAGGSRQERREEEGEKRKEGGGRRVFLRM